MSPLKYKVFATIFLAYITDRVQAYDYEDAMVYCLERINEFFKVHTHVPITTTNYNNYYAFSNTHCAKYAIFHLRDTNDLTRNGICYNSLAKLYYNSLGFALDSTNIFSKEKFCTPEILKVRNLYKNIHTDVETCLNELRDFPASPKEALQYAYFKVCKRKIGFEDFRGLDFAEAYMRSMKINVKIKGIVSNPLRFCRGVINEVKLLI